MKARQWVIKNTRIAQTIVEPDDVLESIKTELARPVQGIPLILDDKSKERMGVVIAVLDQAAANREDGQRSKDHKMIMGAISDCDAAKETLNTVTSPFLDHLIPKWRGMIESIRWPEYTGR